MKLECSSQRTPRAVVLGLLEVNCDWLKIPTSQKPFPGSASQTLFSAETSDSRKYGCVRRLESAWVRDFRPYQLSFLSYALARLEMRHTRILGAGIPTNAHLKDATFGPPP